MENNIGFRIFQNISATDPALVALFRGIPSSNIGDNMNRMYSMRSYIKPFNNIPLLGAAITVKAPMGDNLMIHAAMDLAKPGDIIVVDGEGCEDRALAGEMMVTYAEGLGIGGFIFDGAIRDVDGIRKASIPVYARAVTPQGPFKNGPGEINVPIACGGQVVFPGDILVGDEDGIVVIRPGDAQALAQISRIKHAQEEQKLTAQRGGDVMGQQHMERYNRLLTAAGAQLV